jgi:uroporphyrinogen decarboxylase
MKPRERVEAALRLSTDIDRPPVMAWGHDFVAEWSPTELAASTVRRVERFGWDIAKLQPRASCFAEAFGSRYVPSGSDRVGPRLESWPIDGVESWGFLPEVDGRHPALDTQVESVGRVVDALGSERLVLQTVFSPFTVASYLAADGRAEAARKRPDLIAKDQSRAVRHLRERPDLVEQGLATIAAALVDYIRRSIAAGASGLFYAIGGSASSEALDQAEYESLLLRYDLEVLDSVPGDIPIFLHLCGPRLNFDLASALPVSAVSWATTDTSNPGLAEGRDRLARATVGGVAEIAVLRDGNATEVAQAVEAALDDTGGRGLIVGPGCSVPPTVSDLNLAAMATAAATVEFC